MEIGSALESQLIDARLEFFEAYLADIKEGGSGNVERLLEVMECRAEAMSELRDCFWELRGVAGVGVGVHGDGVEHGYRTYHNKAHIATQRLSNVTHLYAEIIFDLDTSAGSSYGSGNSSDL